MRSTVRLACCLGILALAPAPAPAPAAAAAGAARHHRPAKPRAFASCTGLVRYARRHFATTHGVPDPAVGAVAESPSFGVRAPGPTTQTAGNTPQASAGPETAPSYSTTNVQEAGIDEPDMVKTNGSTMFVVSGPSLYAVRVVGGKPQLVGSVGLGSPGNGYGYGGQLLLRGNRLIVVLRGSGPTGIYGSPPGGGPAIAGSQAPYYYQARTVIAELDVRDPSAMRVTRTMTVDGSFVDARENGRTARLVFSSAPRTIVQPGLAASANGWVPARHFHSLLSGRRYTRPVASCRAIARPSQFSGLGMLTILTLDLDRGLWAADSRALMADAQVVYGSSDSLYVATQRWVDPRLAADEVPSETTIIDRFDASSRDRTPFRSTGEVPGFLLNQFSMSEYKGRLRVATTSRPNWWGDGGQRESQSYVTVLAERGAGLVPVGQIAGLGRGQRIFSVRFVGPAGYVVTFRQIDPLYTLDLSSPSDPRVVGQLELAGFSSYLHPLTAGLLLGVGQDAGPGRSNGLQLELFDVGNPAAPRLAAKTTLGAGSSSQVQYDHHAFLYWPATRLAVLPVQIYDQGPVPGPGPQPAIAKPAPQQGFVGAIGFRVDAAALGEVGRITQDVPAPIQRSIVVGDNVFTVSDTGVEASRLDNLAREAFAAFPSTGPKPEPPIAQALSGR